VIVCSVLKQKALALSLGATAFLDKPVSEQAILGALQALQAG
jgi:FixJ family two-component response regulator